MAKERYVNQSRVAEIKGVTRQAIRKAVNEGRLLLQGEGRAARIDLQCPMTVAYLDGVKVSATAKKTARAKPKVAPSNKDKPTAAPEVSPPDAPPGAADALAAFEDKQVVERKIKAETLIKLKLDNKKKRNELIDRDSVAVFINSMHEIDNGLWKTLGLKISTDVGAVFESDDDKLIRDACAVIEKEVFNILKQIKRDQNKFLKKIGAAKLPTGKAAA